MLLSGDHKKIEEWRYQQSLERTRCRRPDLYEKSCRVFCIWYGDEEAGHFAELLTADLSRYGELLNFNRKKLRKQKFKFDRKDLVVLVIPGKKSADWPEELEDCEILRNLKGNQKRYVMVSAEKMRGKPDFEKILEDKDFRCIGKFTRTDPETEKAAEKISLEIRKKLIS